MEWKELQWEAKSSLNWIRNSSFGSINFVFSL
jgi:hypothetical protein